MEVEEILKMEEEYCKNHNDEFVLDNFDAVGQSNAHDDLSFLSKGYIARQYEASSKQLEWEELRNKGLTDFEILMLLCFVGFLSYAFRWDSYEDKPTPIKEMCKGLDSVLDKAPMFEGDVLYRFCTNVDRIDFEVGDIYRPPHYVTTTTDDWEQDTDRYIITPIAKNSNARRIFKLLNHGNENQVTFRRGTQFKVQKIEKNGHHKIIYMAELNKIL